MNTTPKPIAIFKPGRHTAMNGAAFAFSESDLVASASAYDPALHEAPLVIGHPNSDGPAYGWAAGLSFADGLLRAQPRDIAPEFADWVERKFYKKISAAFYPPAHPLNPVPGVYYLRHIGFLGAQPPAVKGLPDPVFGAGDEGVLMMEFSEEVDVSVNDDEAAFAERENQLKQQQVEMTERDNRLKQQAAEFAEREAKLLAQEQAARKRELIEFAEAQIKAGKLLPKDKAGCVAFMAQLAESQVIEFSEDDEQKSVGALTWFKGFVAGLPKSIEFGEVGGDAGDKGTPGLSIDAAARKARAYHKAQTEAGVSISFSEAVDAVLAREA